MALRKHARSPEDDLIIRGKRMKLDNLFGDLSLTEKEYQSKLEPDYVVNPKIKHTLFKKPGTSPGGTINSYIAEKLMDHFNNVIASSLLVLPWYNPRRLVMFRLERWTIKMFNRFLRKYNIRHHTRIKLAKSCHTIFEMIRQNNLHYVDLLKILFQENALELHRLREKRQKKVQQEQEDEVLDVRYDYWDGHFKDNVVEIEMDEDEDEDEVDTMEIDEMEPIESNYGSYYYDSQSI